MTVTRFSLAEARSAVLRVIADLADPINRVISAADAQDLTHRVNSFTTTFELDEWVFRTPLLKTRFCRFPLCFNPPRPPHQAEDGSRRGGNPPAYCSDGVDERRHPHDDPQYAKRRREALRREHQDSPTDAASTPDKNTRPASQARTTMATHVQTIVHSLNQVVGAVGELKDLAERASDEAVHIAEIEAIQADADERVAHEQGLRLAAEAREHAAVEDAKRMASDIEEIQTILDRLTEQAAADRAAREEAIANEAAAADRAVQAVHDADLRVTAERERADQEVAEAKATFEQQLRDREEEMAALVAAADAAREEALAEADQREREAAVAVAASQQAATDAQDALRVAQDELDRLRQETAELLRDNAKLRDAAIAREQAIEITLAELNTTHQRQQDALQSKIDQLRTQADQARSEHERAVAALQVKHERDLEARLAEAAATAARIHKAEVDALNIKIDMLQAARGN